MTFEVTVPDGVKPGDRLQATTPSGVKVKLVVPEKAEPGMSLTFTLPKSHSPKETQAATVIQCRMRGKKARNGIATTGTGSKGAISKEAHSNEGGATLEPTVHLTATADVEKAAVALQASFRGHTVRNDQQEQSRLQWIECA